MDDKELNTKENGIKVIKLRDVAVVSIPGRPVLNINLNNVDWDTVIEYAANNDITAIEDAVKVSLGETVPADIQYIKDVKVSKVLELVDPQDNIVIFPEVSPLSVPKELGMRIIEAEKQMDVLKLETYKNFWTLMCLNTDETCRKNLFWFLEKYGLTISKSGFFVAYRYVEKTKKEGHYTDNRTHSFDIEIGKMVVMDRKACDSNSEVTCSRGLHCAGYEWIKSNGKSFGNVGIVCLVNPADVVAVPRQSDYGKFRTCAYLPVALATYKNDVIVPYVKDTGFECEYVPQVIYEGLMGTEKDSEYKIKIPSLLDAQVKVNITNNLLDMARECIVDRSKWV